MKRHDIIASSLLFMGGKINIVYNALTIQADLYYTMNKIAEAKATREEAYMWVSEAYSPLHPLVLDAGGKLISILTVTGDHYDVERFAK
jgi:hypothetical protein